MTDIPILWERQPLETDPAYAAFCIYRDKGPCRSLRGAADEAQVSRSQIDKWAQRYAWRRRIRAFTEEMDHQKRIKAYSERKKMADNHIAISQALLSKGLARLSSIKPEDLRPGEAARLIQLGVELEVRARSYEDDPLVSQERLGDTDEGAALRLVKDADAEADLTERPLTFDDVLAQSR